jgi:hypothetical protein
MTKENKLEIKGIKIKLEKIIFGKLGLDDEIENKSNFYKRSIIKIRN